MEFGFELVCDQLRAGSSYLLEAGRGPVSYTHLTLPTILRV